MKKLKRNELKQCETCPWKVDCNPEEDIPGYSLEQAKKLTTTISDGGTATLTQKEQRIMACHYSVQGRDIPCVGWLHNQLGIGNNLGVRMSVMAGTLPVPVVEGEQHLVYEDTLPESALV